jgi:hypothetical protein
MVRQVLTIQEKSYDMRSDPASARFDNYREIKELQNSRFLRYRKIDTRRLSQSGDGLRPCVRVGNALAHYRMLEIIPRWSRLQHLKKIESIG